MYFFNQFTLYFTYIGTKLFTLITFLVIQRPEVFQYSLGPSLHYKKKLNHHYRLKSDKTNFMP